MPNTLTYQIDSDTFSAQSDPVTLAERKLRDEIEEAVDPARVVDVCRKGEACCVSFTGEPTADEVDAATAAIGAHMGALPLSMSLAMGDYLVVPAVLWEPPHDFDYVKGLTIRMERKETLIQGELQTIEYHPSASASASASAAGDVAYDNGVIVREDFTYVRDAAGFALSRLQTISWMRKDGTGHPLVKVRPKTYNRKQSIKEGKRRRGNVIDEVEMAVAGLLIETELANLGGDIQATLGLGRALTKEYGDEIRDYKEVSLSDIYTAVDTDSAFAWLDNLPPSLGGSLTIRNLILILLDIWS